MTIEEKIKILENEKAYMLSHGGDRQAIALDAAIKALNQEPCEDTISRQAVLEYIEGSEAELGHDSENESVCQDIKAFPSVTPQPKTGHWIKYGIPRCGEQHYKCTSCGYYINFGQWGELYSKEFKYCPNCGAKMAESEEGNESI